MDESDIGDDGEVGEEVSGGDDGGSEETLFLRNLKGSSKLIFSCRVGLS